MTAPALLSESEAAARLLIAARTLRKLRSQGAIRFVRVTPRRIAYRIDDLDAYIAGNTRQERAPCPSGNLPKARTGTMISSSRVVAFTDLLAARAKATQNA